MWRFVALIALCLVVAPATAQAHNSTASLTPSVTGTIGHSGSRLLLNGKPSLIIMAYAGPCTTTPDYVQGALTMGAVMLEDQVLRSLTGGHVPCDVPNLQDILGGHIWYYSSDPAIAQQLSDMPGYLNGSAAIKEFVADSGVCPNYRGGPYLCLYNQLHSAAKKQPVVAMIDVAQMQDANHHNYLSATQLHAWFWTTFASGGSGVDYYAHALSGYSFSVLPGLSVEAKQDASKLAVLEPAITTGKSIAVPSSNAAVKLGAWQLGGATYIIAANTTDSPSTTTFTVPRATTSRVMWEGRSLKMSQGKFGDRFAGLGVHIYKLT